MVLNKRIFRDLKHNFITYIVIFFIIAISMYVVISMAGAAETVIQGVDEHAIKNRVETGQFTAFQPLSEENINDLSNLGITIEEHFNIDFVVDQASVRVYQLREKVDLLEETEGVNSPQNQEIVLEQHYAESNGYKIGSIINIGGIELNVVGVGSTPDYDDVLKNMSDASSNPKLFGTSFVNEATYLQLLSTEKAEGIQTYEYGFICDEALLDKVRGYLKECNFELENIEDPVAYDYFYQFEEGVDDFANAISDMNNASDMLLSSCNDITEAVSDLEIKLSPLEVNLFQLKDGTEKISTSASKLKNAGTGLSDAFDKFRDENVSFEYSNLKSFKNAKDNPRINASANDISVNKFGALIAGGIVIILIAYVTAVFVSNSIEKESKVIGTLLSLGYERRELVRNYVILPVIISFLGGLVGTILGFASIQFQIEDNVTYFSYPKIQIQYPIYLLAYGVIVPLLLALLINYVVLSKKLSQTPLAMLRKTRNTENGIKLKLNNMKYLTVFRIKLFVREIRTNITITLGIFISLLLVVLSVDIYSATTTVVHETENDVQFGYMYYLSYPEDNPEQYNADVCYLKQLNKEIYGFNMTVSILGVDSDNRYYSIPDTLEDDELVISSSVAYKFGLAVGDQFILSDDENKIQYIFEVKDIIQYAPGLYVFMNIDSMRGCFDKADNYYNLLMSDNALNIHQSRIYSTTTGQDLKDAATIFNKLMMGMIYVLIVASIVVFIIVMYLMVRMVIERQKNNISLFKLMGYSEREISKLYLRNNSYLVLLSALIFTPISKWVIDSIYPLMVKNRSVGFNLYYTSDKYLFILGLVLISYIISYLLAKVRLRKVTLSEVLKDVE